MRRRNGPSEVRELVLMIENDADLYRSQHTPILKNLATKKARGVYNKEKAVKLFRYLVDRADKKFYGGGDPWRGSGSHVTLSTADRNAAARELVDHFEREYEYGNYDRLLPKKYQKKSNPARIKLPANWTDAQVRVSPSGDVQVKINPAKLGKGGRFAKCVKEVEAKGGSYDPHAVCAAVERRKYGKRRTQKMAAVGLRRAIRKAHGHRPVAKNRRRRNAGTRKRVMKSYTLVWSPTGQKIATVTATTMRAAIRKAPAPYSRYKGEIYAVEN